jgi:hypothetical protein
MAARRETSREAPEIWFRHRSGPAGPVMRHTVALSFHLLPRCCLASTLAQPHTGSEITRSPS